MTDLERKLAEALREQAREVSPDLELAWAEQQRRQRRPSRRRRAAVWVAPLAAVLVVLTSVSIATQVNTAQPPPPQPATQPGQELVLAKPVISPENLVGGNEPVALTDFAGQTNAWTSYAVNPADLSGRPWFCVETFLKGTTHGGTGSQFGIESPSCVPRSDRVVRAGYVGKDGGPLPAGKAVILVSAEVRGLRLYDAAGDLSPAKEVGALGRDRVFLADVKPGSPPVRYEVNPDQAHPASR
ncbi:MULTISPECIES: hypothetical protein [unclassified Amycolatopsis]|uniref:hypothetical protein n=1 Tax=unclassified Amycolatopsis TaxID=2618356 RepID=UPI002875A888|nr:MULTISPECIES: hypothetical protein [unclassified Amycolatopsis]MDS0133158.1 hypothetical protein [Amycolatopsis sp. 505]MDS0142017.1 hypothetical protein [Amycolatopsis sp. CM201R]